MQATLAYSVGPWSSFRTHAGNEYSYQRSGLPVVVVPRMKDWDYDDRFMPIVHC